MSQQNRRDFLKKATAATAAAATASVIGAPAVHAQKSYTWKMVTTWPPHFPVLGEGADKLADWVGRMSQGQLKIEVYGDGELVPALQAFEAVSQGMVEMGHGASYYWAGRSPASQFFSAVPFGMTAQQMNAWIYSGGGQHLWDKVYAPYNLKPLPAGNTGVQMGGWFNREIKTIQDFKGIKMRIPGLGGQVLARAGGTPVLSSGAEIFSNLERGVIDAAEWIGPYHDYLMGLYKIARYYYYPGWQEPGTTLEVFVNKKVWKKLPPHLQEIITSATMRLNLWTLSEFEAKNNAYLKKLTDEHGVQLKRFPAEVIKTLRTYADEVLKEAGRRDKTSQQVYEHFHHFQNNIQSWAKISENAFSSLLK